MELMSGLNFYRQVRPRVHWIHVKLYGKKQLKELCNFSNLNGGVVQKIIFYWQAVRQIYEFPFLTILQTVKIYILLYFWGEIRVE